MKQMLFMLIVCACILGCSNAPAREPVRFNGPEIPAKFSTDDIEDDIWLKYDIYDEELKNKRELNYHAANMMENNAERTWRLEGWRWYQWSEREPKEKHEGSVYKYGEYKPIIKETAYRIRYAINGHIFFRYTFKYDNRGGELRFNDAETGQGVVVVGPHEIVTIAASATKESVEKQEAFFKLMNKRNDEIDEWIKTLPKSQQNLKKYNGRW